MNEIGKGQKKLDITQQLEEIASNADFQMTPKKTNLEHSFIQDDS